MKNELEKYLESQTKINEQTFHMRKTGMVLSISLIIIGLLGIVIAAILI